MEILPKDDACKNLLNTINLNNTNLLSLLNSSILIQSHCHPLIYCFTRDREKFGDSWKCNKCGGIYLYTTPSFYCIYCDFDICAKCILQHQLFEIVLYDYNSNLFNNILNNPMTIFKWQYIYPCHNHLITLIKKVNNNYSWRCTNCKNTYGNQVALYYCSLCDYSLCQICSYNFMNSNNNNNMNK